MKYLIAFGVAILILGCTPSEKETTTCNVFLIDVSDSVTPELTVFDKRETGCPSEEQLWAGHITRYGVISNTEYAKITKYELKSKNYLFSNELERREEVKQYSIQLQGLKHADSLEYEGSLIWSPLWHELEYLSQDTTLSATVYLVSDLLENNSWANFYSPRTRRLFQRNPEHIRKLFEAKMLPLKHTKHISVVLVHEPYTDTHQNEFYALIVEEIYKPLLEQVGISVTVQTKI